MKKRLITGLAVAGTLAITAPLLVSAQGGPEAGAQGPRADSAQRQDGAQRQDRMHRHEGMHRMPGRHQAHEGGYGAGRWSGHGYGHGYADGSGHGYGHGYGGARALRGLDLSEAQRDKLFELRHAQAPALRAQGKIIRDARRELRALSMSADYDDAKAREIGERAAKAVAELAQLHARAANEFWKVLTPEQREKLSQRASRGEGRGGPGKGPRS